MPYVRHAKALPTRSFAPVRVLLDSDFDIPAPSVRRSVMTSQLATPTPPAARAGATVSLGPSALRHAYHILSAEQDHSRGSQSWTTRRKQTFGTRPQIFGLIGRIVHSSCLSLAPSKLRPRWRCHFHFLTGIQGAHLLEGRRVPDVRFVEPFPDGRHHHRQDDACRRASPRQIM